MASAASINVQVIIFAAREDFADGYGRARILEKELCSRNLLNVNITFVDRMTSDLEALTLVAKHKVVHSPMVVVLKNNKTTVRRIGVPPLDHMLRYLDSTTVSAMTSTITMRGLPNHART